MLASRVIVTRYGDHETLELISEPLREPAPDEVRVKVQSAGVALADVMRREGVYPHSPVPPFTPGYDAVGIVDRIGADIHSFTAGEQVAVFFNGTGGYAEYVYAKSGELFSIPLQEDPGLAAAAILNYVSAYQMLHRIARVAEGEAILIHGAGGGVGTALLELGKLAHLVMLGTASAAKHETVARFGGIAIDYRSHDFVKAVRSLVPEGVDAVFDPIGGLNWSRSLQTLSRQGRFVGYGYTSALGQGSSAAWLDGWREMAAKRATEAGNPIHLYSVTSLKMEKPDWFREDLQAVFSLLAEGKISPLLSRRFPLREAAQAQQLLQTSRAVGKIVLMNE